MAAGATWRSSAPRSAPRPEDTRAHRDDGQEFDSTSHFSRENLKFTEKFFVMYFFCIFFWRAGQTHWSDGNRCNAAGASKRAFLHVVWSAPLVLSPSLPSLLLFYRFIALYLLFFLLLCCQCNGRQSAWRHSCDLKSECCQQQPCTTHAWPCHLGCVRTPSAHAELQHVAGCPMRWASHDALSTQGLDMLPCSLTNCPCIRCFWMHISRESLNIIIASPPGSSPFFPSAFPSSFHFLSFFLPFFPSFLFFCSF